MAKKTVDPVQSIRDKLRLAANESGLSQQEIGEKMGLTEKDARKAVSRFLNAKKYDPRLSTLIAFAKAIGRDLKDLV